MWNSLFGYVMIQMEGFGLERLLNKMFQSGIPVWNIRRESATAMSAEIRAKHFFRLRALKRGLRCRVHVVRRHGMPFVLAQLRGRKGLLIGGLALFIALIAASNRVWLITLEGLYRVPEAVVHRALEEAGAEVGMARAGVVPVELGAAVRSYDERIAWAGVRLDGVHLKVQVVEAEPIPEQPDKTGPASVVAQKDGVIEKVTALSGNPAVSEGDVVRAGDILINGMLAREGFETLYVYAEGEVLATVYYTVSVEKPATERALLPTGAAVPYRALFLAGYPVYVSDTPYERCGLEIIEDEVVNGLILPLRQIQGRALELSWQDVTVDMEEQLAMAQFEAEYLTLDRIPRDARILDKASETETLPDGGVRVELCVRTQEQIGITRPLNAQALMDAQPEE